MAGEACSAMTLSRRLAALLGLSAGAYVLGVRPRMLRWGASDEEVRQPFPGAELIPNGQRGTTMAVTIDAPPSRVWPWLVQMGCDRRSTCVAGDPSTPRDHGRAPTSTPSGDSS